MKKIIYILIGTVILAGAWYFISQVERTEPEPTEQVAQNTYATFSQSDLGLEFKYPIGQEGYVVKEGPVSGVGAVSTLILYQTEDYENLNNLPEGGEGPAVISIQVFENTKKQFPGMWAEENTMYSNLNLKIGEVKEVVIGGANAIRYRADGLYASENAVVAHGDSIYVFSGQFIDENSDIRRDFESLLESVRFIPKPDQE